MWWIILTLFGCGLSSEGPAFVVTERELHTFVVTESDRAPPPPVPSESLPDPPKVKRPVVKLYTALPPPGKKKSWCAPCNEFHEEWELWLRSFDSDFDIQKIDADKLLDNQWPSWNPERMVPAYEWQDVTGRTRYIIGKQKPLDLITRWRLTQKK